MVKDVLLLILLFATSVLSQAADTVSVKPDTSDCYRVLYDRYLWSHQNYVGVVLWEKPPLLKSASKEYIDSLCHYMDKVFTEQQRYFALWLLLDDGGGPSCVAFDPEVMIDEAIEQRITALAMNLRFSPAEVRKKNVESYYRLVLSFKDGRWHYPKEAYWDY